jgi:CHAD domain-containing protein
MHNVPPSVKPRARHTGSRRRTAKAALRQQLARAIAELDGNTTIDDVSVHEARKELKRARATLRLLREAIGDAVYRRANRRLRDAARPLSRVRNAKVLLGVLAKLCDDTNKPSRRRELAALERKLSRERQRARIELKRSAGLRRVRRAVASVLSDTRAWPAATDDALRRGVERIYRKGRKTFARAEEDGRTGTLHESRKQTKYLGKSLEVLAAVRGRRIKKPVKRADAVVGALGEDHDLAMLCKELSTSRRADPPRRALLTLIEDRRATLQRKAAKRARRLYRRKPKAFVAALH